MLTFCHQHCTLPGKVEQWLVIMDLDGVALSQIPVNALRKFLSLAQNTFRARCHRAYILNAGWLLRSAWACFSAMLDATSAQKVVLLGNDYKTVLADLIDQDKLEVRFGGSVLDKKGEFFPPNLTE